MEFETTNEPKGTVSCPKRKGGCGHKFRIYTNLLEEIKEKTGKKLQKKDWNEYSNDRKHDFIKIVKPKTGICSICNERKKTDLANIDHVYSDNPDDWMELCRSCHLTWDLEHNDRLGDFYKQREREWELKWEQERLKREQEQTELDLKPSLLLTAVNNYLKGYKKSYERVKTDELSETKRKYEEMLAEKKKLENLL